MSTQPADTYVKTTGTIQSVDRALSILECFSLERQELGVSELARLLSLNKSTAFGLVSTLERRGYLQQNSDNGKYGLGLKALDLATIRLAAFSFTRVARPILKALVDRLGETVHLAIYDRGEVVYVDKIESSSTIQIASFIGKRNPCYCTGVGKCLLAFQPEAEVERVVAGGLAPRTAKTITNPDAFRAALAHIRSVDQAIDDEEFELGLVCVAAPIRDSSRAVCAAISVSSPTFRIGRDTIVEIARQVSETAAAVSQSLGYVAL